MGKNRKKRRNGENPDLPKEIGKETEEQNRHHNIRKESLGPNTDR